jgi:endonuclease/exonuclease/phosphatase family metal-dependent hydrolase
MSVSMERLRVATLNVWNKSGPWAERMTLVREQMSALALDVLGLQEVLELETPAATTNQADELKPVGWHRAYAAAHDMAVAWVPKGQSLHFGNALLSRFPIVRSSSHPLPGADLSDQKRCVLHAVVEAPFGEVDFFVTHLNWKLDEGWIRELQVKTVAKLVAELAPDDGRFPPVVMGDFNAEPQSDEIRYLGGFARLGEPRSVRFADAWAYADVGAGAGFTFDASRNAFAVQYHEAPRRIDYVFVRGPDAKGRGRPMSPRLCFDEDRAGVFPSDHFGVCCDLAVAAD